VKTSYRMVAGVGACVVSSTPYRTLNYTHPTIEPTLEWKRMLSDQSGRTTSISIFKGSEPDCQTIQSTGETRAQYDIDYEYLAGVSRIRVTDPAGKIRDEERDALGRLVRVVEAPTIPALNYPTIYLYDPLDNLIEVHQGTQTRGFAYTTLGRLRSATNPESGAITYDYYASGDLMRRTQGSIESTYTYDELHRILRKTYSGGLTPQVHYEYYLTGSSSSSNIGQPKSVTNSVASTVYNGYDAFGHVLSTTQTIYGTPNSSYTLNYPDWWLNDTMKSMQYPSGKIVQYEVDDAGRIKRVSSATKLYADLPASANPYTADGWITRMMLGNDLWETRDYQTPGTPTLLRLGTFSGANDKLELEYNYDAVENNGNVIRQVIRQAGKTWVQKYSYDGLNRLDCAWEGIVNNEPSDNTCQPAQPNKWIQAYGYDRYGNRWIDSTRTGGLQGVDIHEPMANVFNADNNRISNLAYDPAGNLEQYEPRTLTYDAENRLISATSANNGSAYFSYDGDGRRITKVWAPSGGTPQTTLYVYDVAGRLAVEYSTQTAVSGTFYPYTDLLGSVRAVSGDKPSGGTAAIVECYDYLPFGRLLRSDDNSRNTGCYPANPDYALSSRLPQKFTGKERDGETGLDFFLARYFSSAQGRFASPDPLLDSGRPEDPQSWNRYAYGRNNPLRFVDPTGLDAISVEDCEKNPECTVVSVNVIYDKNANIRDKNGNVEEWVQKKVGAQLDQAADEYGNAQVAFDVSYTAGTVEKRKNDTYEVTGAVDNALNVAITDANGMGNFRPGVSFIGDSGRSFSLINAYQSKQSTIAHEYAHHFTGNVRLPVLVGFLYNAFADLNNDAGRATLRNWNSPALRVLRAIDPFLDQRRRAIGQYGRQWFGGTR